jgi:hypothetical protein
VSTCSSVHVLLGFGDVLVGGGAVDFGGVDDVADFVPDAGFDDVLPVARDGAVVVFRPDVGVGDVLVLGLVVVWLLLPPTAVGAPGLAGGM